ncbi:multidrug efflux SMR transporter [Flavobacteriaceae bacterium]|nr:multidrug efflux SMR transporter [Flavobacteriaceae bacterium]
MKWIYLLFAIIGEIIATSALKASNGFTQLIPSVLVVVGYGFSFYFMSLTLKMMPLGITYAIWSGVGIVLISIIGYFFYNQKLDVPAIIGISFILCGVVVIRFYSKSMA